MPLTRGTRGEPPAIFSVADLIAAWKSCKGGCAVSGMPFGLQIVGDGQAKRPFAPSLDRIDRHKPYSRDHVRLVVSIANSAMNSWGVLPLLQLANAIQKMHGGQPLPLPNGPPDGDLDDIATMDAEHVETNVGTLRLPPRADMHRSILDLLRKARHSSRDIEHNLAIQFGITPQMRTTFQRSGIPAWRNHVSRALVDLGANKLGTGQIESIEKRRAPDGGQMGIYRLMGNGDR